MEWSFKHSLEKTGEPPSILTLMLPRAFSCSGPCPPQVGIPTLPSLSRANQQPSDAVPFWLELVSFGYMSCRAWHLSQTPTTHAHGLIHQVLITLPVK